MASSDFVIRHFKQQLVSHLLTAGSGFIFYNMYQTFPWCNCQQNQTRCPWEPGPNHPWWGKACHPYTEAPDTPLMVRFAPDYRENLNGVKSSKWGSGHLPVALMGEKDLAKKGGKRQHEREQWIRWISPVLSVEERIETGLSFAVGWAAAHMEWLNELR